MTEEERAETVARLERLAKLAHDQDVSIETTDAQPGVLFGYAFNISKCKGYRRCVEACINENNLDRHADTQYIRIFEMEDGVVDLDDADATFQHEVPAEGHFYLGTQCFQCANPPCVPVCPVGATWQEPDGIVVVDYNWCIGCRVLHGRLPLLGAALQLERARGARRGGEPGPALPRAIGPARRACVEKCTFCIHRTRQGRLPACAEACPTGARVFGNLLDPDSEIRWVLAQQAASSV